MSARTHGHTVGRKFSPEYRSYHAMLQRCYYKKSRHYKDYGGRGIVVCERWRNSFETFLHDMGPRSAGMTLERKDANGNYEPSNCRWANDIEQANNRRGNVHVEYRGKRLTVAQWARELGISYAQLQSRLDREWPLEIAMDPSKTLSGEAFLAREQKRKAERDARLNETIRCEYCGTPCHKKTVRTTCCSDRCRKNVTNNRYYHENAEAINAKRRTAVLEG